MNLKSLASVLKCMGIDDTVTLKADDDGDKLTLMFESPGGWDEVVPDLGACAMCKSACSASACSRLTA